MAGALLGLMGVAMGAFGAHGLREQVSARDLEIWKTGAHYQQLHAVMVVLVGVLARRDPSKALRVSAALFITGIAIFSGTLYTMVLGGPRILGAVTPLGGLSLMGGWLSLFAFGVAARRKR
jgi:uncharacterized membrane protein YgdD (TMEM256/DUF423 family)